MALNNWKITLSAILLCGGLCLGAQTSGTGVGASGSAPTAIGGISNATGSGLDRAVLHASEIHTGAISVPVAPAEHVLRTGDTDPSMGPRQVNISSKSTPALGGSVGGVLHSAPALHGVSSESGASSIGSRGL